MISHWRIFTDTKTAEKALRLHAKLMERTTLICKEPTAAAYHKGGHTVEFTLEHSAPDWPQLVFDVLCVAQQLGYGWHLGSFVAEELDLWSTGCSVPGVSNIHVFAPGPGTQYGE